MALFEKITFFVAMGIVVGFDLREKYYLIFKHHNSVKKAAKCKKYETVGKIFSRAFILAQLERSSCFCLEVMVSLR